MVDASCGDRLDEAREALNKVATHDRMMGKPMLIFANKQDSQGALKADQLRQKLHLEGHGSPSSVVCIKYLMC